MTKYFITASFISALLLTACTPMKISVSNELKNTKELPVKGRNGLLINQKLSFGVYRTEKINRSWTEGSSIDGGAMKALWARYSDKKQSIHFSLADSAGNHAEVFCLAKTHTEDWTVGENPNSLVNIMGDVLGIGGTSDNTYAVSIYLPKEASPWQMMVDLQQVQGNSKHYIGYLAQSKDSYYTVHPIVTVEKNGKKGVLPVGSVGFEIRNRAGAALAAVSLIDNGKVYLSDVDPKEKFLLANACAALLLHETID